MPQAVSFIVAIDFFDTEASPADVKELLRRAPAIQAWWNHVPGIFLVTSTLDANGLTDLLRTVTGDAALLVSRVDLEQTEGWLPAPAWNWIRKRQRSAA